MHGLEDLDFASRYISPLTTPLMLFLHIALVVVLKVVYIDMYCTSLLKTNHHADLEDSFYSLMSNISIEETCDCFIRVTKGSIHVPCLNNTIPN